MAAEPTRAPVVLYVGGWGRSGSTLADLLAGRLPGFVSVGEVRELFLRGVLENRRCGCGEAFADCAFWSEVGEVAFGGWTANAGEAAWSDLRRVDRGWTTPAHLLPRTPQRGEFAAATARTVDRLRRLYAAIAAVSGASVVVDSSKLPNYAALLRRAGMDVRVAHLVRDPRGVMYSWQKQVERPDSTGAGDEMLRYSAVSGSARYVLYNGLTQLLGVVGAPYQRLRYEQLVSEPAESLAALAAFAGVDLAPGELDWAREELLQVGTVHTVDGNPMRMGADGIRLRLDDAWRTRLPERDRRAVSAITAPLRWVYGYAGGTSGAAR